MFPDAESKEMHMHGVGELADKAFEYMEIVSFELYGKPGDSVLRECDKSPTPGLYFTLSPNPLAVTPASKPDRPLWSNLCPKHMKDTC